MESEGNIGLQAADRAAGIGMKYLKVLTLADVEGLKARWRVR